MANPPRPNLRKLRCERLEDRRLLAVVTVDTVEDIVDLNDGRTSLREAIFATNTVPGPDEIVFDFGVDGPTTILLTQGELQITDSLTINGPGAELLTIDASGNDPTPDSTHEDGDDTNDGDGSRVFSISDGIRQNHLDVVLSGLTITGGDAAFAGGGIFTYENLTLIDSVITGNSVGRFFDGIAAGGGLAFFEQPAPQRIVATQTSSADHEAAFGLVASEKNRLTLTRTVVENNALRGQYAYGAGIGIRGNTEATIDGSTVRNNAITAVRGYGGGINVTGDVAIQISDSKVVDNVILGRDAFGGGMAIGNRRTSETVFEQVNIHNSVISGNSLIPVPAAGFGVTGYGGGIYGLSANVSISDSVIRENQIGDFAGDARGGGILLSSSGASISDSVIASNRIDATSLVAGGGLSLTAAGESPGQTIEIRSTRISDNVAASELFAQGGGLHIAGPAIVSASTINNNHSSGSGGGVYVDGNANSPTQLSNLTVSSNQADFNGGGVYVEGAADIAHSTIAFNRSDADESGDGAGGGVYSSRGNANLNHTIVAGNIDSSGTAPDVAGVINSTFSLIGIGAEFLAPLADNGGPTLTHALLPGSPAMNAGAPTAIAGENGVPSSDQRGEGFDRIIDRIDIGAFEIGAFGDVSLLVDRLEDEFDYDFRPGNLSLREAIWLANSHDDLDEIFFDRELFENVATSLVTMTLVGGEFRITDQLTIHGPGSDKLLIDAKRESRIFHVLQLGAGTANFDTTLTGLSLARGKTSASGGAVYAESEGKLMVEDLTINDSEALGMGGGIAAKGNLQLIDSVIKNSRALERNLFRSGRGGGVHVSGSATVIRSSLEGNRSDRQGGGIYVTGDLNLIESIIHNNVGIGSGGGGAWSEGDVTITRSVISDNLSTAVANFTGRGGGVHSEGELDVMFSEISGNQTYAQVSHGGGLYSESNISIRYSTLAGNSVFGGSNGGGAYTRGVLSVTSSTISGNLARGFGGGLAVGGRGTIELRNSTVTQNVATGTAGRYGGIFSNQEILVDHSIVAGNLRRDITGNESPDDLSDPFSADSSLIGIGAEFLAPLADNGGPTLTHALLPGSPAINAGDLNVVPGTDGVPEFDQRGNPYRRIFGSRIDIGAVEFQPIPGDFDNDGDSDAADLASWTADYGTLTDGNGFLNWQRTFGDGVIPAPRAIRPIQEPAAEAFDAIDRALAAEFVNLPTTEQPARGPVARRNAYAETEVLAPPSFVTVNQPRRAILERASYGESSSNSERADEFFAIDDALFDLFAE